MHRRRTALVVSAAVLLSAPLLTACGSTSHPGAAAVVGDDRITVSQLQHEVNVVRDAQRSSPQGQQLLANSARLNQDTLIRLVQNRIVQQAAEDNGVEVTRREVQRRRAEVERSNGGAETVRARFLALGIAPDRIDEALTMDLTRAKLDGKLGAARTNDVLRRTSDALHVDVNPRYGTWDPKRGTAEPAREPWLRVAAPAPGEPMRPA
ncbi:SurA N-terminal domain-containing protein [Streptomyces syringium]|uniref:SurA N-terminal domain-containing protein n=1 Tax=Streptomyces syringium TaxID=76729 RepID=UPI0034563554